MWNAIFYCSFTGMSYFIDNHTVIFYRAGVGDFEFLLYGIIVKKKLFYSIEFT